MKPTINQLSVKSFTLILLCLLPGVACSSKNQATPPKNTSPTKAIVSEIKAGKEIFRFPVISTPTDKLIANRINTDIVRSVLGEEYTPQNLRQKLQARNKEIEGGNWNGLSELSYEISYNNRHILSLVIWSCGIGAYESCGSQSLTYDLRTGKRMSIEQIINPTKMADFRKLVGEALKTRLLDSRKEQFIDSVAITQCWQPAYERASNYAEIDLTNFKITKSGIEFTIICVGYPHVI